MLFAAASKPAVKGALEIHGCDFDTGEKVICPAQLPLGIEIVMAWMYILKCCDGTYYVGSTKDLNRRLSQHQDGIGANYTSERLPVILVYCEEYERVDEAFYREKQVQGWGRSKREALINGQPELLPALAKKDF